MDTFTIGWPHGWPFGGLSRNGLPRPSDRVESIVVLTAAVFAVVAIPFAATVGASVRDFQISQAAAVAASIRPASATVTGEPELSTAHLFHAEWSVPVRWDVDGAPRDAVIASHVKPEVGEPMSIWIDRNGRPAPAPAPTASATANGISVAVMLWLAALGADVGAVQLLRWRLDARRSAQWERELQALADDGGGRSRH